MSVEFNFSHSAEDVFELFCDPDFLVERCMAIGELSADVEVEEDDSGKVTVSMTREVKRELPAFLAKMFNPQQVVRVVETWQQIGDNFTGKGEITVDGQPVNIKTSFTLKSTDNGSVFAIKYAPKASIPLIGGRVEKFIEGQSEKDVLKELEYMAEKLG